MTIDEAIELEKRPEKWKRNLNQVRREFEKVKEELTFFGHPANRPENEGYYQYWRGVRNGLMWVLYNIEEPINSCETEAPWK